MFLFPDLILIIDKVHFMTLLPISITNGSTRNEG